MILHTERLILKSIKVEEAPFYYTLFKDPDWIKFISDKGLNSIEETAKFLNEDFIPKTCRNGLGFFTVYEAATNTPIGASSVLKRDKLEFPDVGYGFLPKGRGKGYALEATQRILQYVKEELQQEKAYAFTKPNNKRSQNLLIKLGFDFIGVQEVFKEAKDSVFEIRL